MTNRIKKWLCIALSAAMALTAMVFPASADASWWLPDIAGHWAEAEIKAAASGRWVTGYPDGTFRPDADVTRAEFVKLLLDATHLFPGGATADYLHKVSSYAHSDDALTDMDGHWLTKQGWTDVALDFGLILPSDYPGGAFLPNQSATRCEAAVMIVRALGLVYPAQKAAEAELPFTDGETIPQSLRGYVLQAVEACVLNGYPDGSFQCEKTISRAEAVVMILRALTYMEEGIDPDIQAFAEEAWVLSGEKQRLKIWLSVPAQVIDGTVYLPARDVIAANAALYNATVEWSLWDAECQQISLTYVFPFQSGAGDARYTWFWGPISDYASTFPVPARLLYGELMIPVYTPGVTDLANLWHGVQWDAEAKTLLMPLREQYPPLS